MSVAPDYGFGDQEERALALAQLHQPLVLTVSCVDRICVALFRSKGAETMLRADARSCSGGLGSRDQDSTVRRRLCRCLARQSYGLGI